MTRWVRRLINMFRRERLERELEAELEAHLGLETDRNLRAGMDPAEARRMAHARLGGVEQVKERWREDRPFHWLGGFGLDVKLGLRMLRKSWGLTLVGGLAMTVVIGIAAGTFSFMQTQLGSTVPLDDGERVVALMTWDAEASRQRNPSRADFERWRDGLTSVEDVGAFRTVERNLVIAGGPTGEPVSVAEMTASGFELARVSPLFGRPLVEADERDGAVPVVVIGYEAWQSRFSADPAVLGQHVQLGATVHTVVGVMPADFRFPVNHQFWAPLPAETSAGARDAQLEAFVFARLAPEVTVAGAQAELATLGLLPPADLSDGVERVEPRVVSYTLGLTTNGNMEELLFARLVGVLVSLLLLPPCANIAILVYARTITRQEEFAARYALGASRGRIVGQLFVEVLVLAAGSASAALVLLHLFYSLDPFTGVNEPFWLDYGVSFTTVLFAAGLAVVAAMIAGVVPALQATGRQLQLGLRALGSGTGMRLGATWTALVVGQVAVSVALLPGTVEFAWGSLRSGILGPGFAAEEYLTARLALDRETSSGGLADPRPFVVQFADRLAELVRQLETEPGVSAVTLSAAAPGLEPWAQIEVDDDDSGSPAVGGVSDRPSRFLAEVNRVDENFFDAFDVPLLTGRSLVAGDREPAGTAVVVNRTLAQDVATDGNPLGRRIRYVQTQAGRVAAGPWYEIVGVVDDLPANSDRRRIYHPMVPGQVHPLSLVLRVGPTSAGMAGRLRELTLALDPTLRVDQIRSLDVVYRQYQVANSLLPALLLASVMFSVLLLSAAGLYALMSFTVNYRRREIGIRSALGAQPHRLLAGLFRRALVQVAVGAVVGLLVAFFIDYYLPLLEVAGFHNVPGIVPGAAALMLAIGLLAAVGPARRGLRIEPTEALREG